MVPDEGRCWRERYSAPLARIHRKQEETQGTLAFGPVGDDQPIPVGRPSKSIPSLKRTAPDGLFCQLDFRTTLGWDEKDHGLSVADFPKENQLGPVI
jgi:hypothetical protein